MSTIYTAGHGNRSIEEFIALLSSAEIQCLITEKSSTPHALNPLARLDGSSLIYDRGSQLPPR